MVDAIKEVLTSYVLQSSLKDYRWLDAWGDVAKYKLDMGFPVDDTTGDPLGWTSTVTEAGTGTQVFTASTTAGEVATLTTATTEYDGGNYQVKGSAIKFTTGKPFYAGAQIKMQNATKSDLLFGVCGIDTTLLATAAAHGVAVSQGGAFFVTLADSTSVAAKVYQTATQSNSTAVDATLDNDYHFYEMYYDGEGLKFYFDGSLVSCVTADFPTEDLTLSINFRCGDDGVEIAYIKDLMVRQVNS